MITGKKPMGPMFRLKLTRSLEDVRLIKVTREDLPSLCLHSISEINSLLKEKTKNPKTSLCAYLYIYMLFIFIVLFVKHSSFGNSLKTILSQ